MWRPGKPRGSPPLSHIVNKWVKDMLPSGQRALETVSVGPSGLRTYYMQRQRAWQKVPFNLVLPYYFKEGQYSWKPGPSPPAGSPPNDASSMPDTRYDVNLAIQARNNGYERMRGNVYDTVGAGVDAVEYRQSLGMMARTCGTLMKSVLQVKRLDFLGAAKTLKMHFVPPNVSKRRAWSNNWLEYHFGWEPLIKDVYDAIEVVNEPLKQFMRVRGSARVIHQGTLNFNFGSVTRKGWWVGHYVGYQGCSVRTIQNSTIHSLEQWGVLNPLSLAWEVVPFSFVVDWFVNVGDVLRSVSDFAGMTLERQYTTNVYRTWEAGIIYANPGFVAGTSTFSGSGVLCGRAAGLSGPTLNVKKLTLPSKARAATALALFTQVLGK